MNIIYHKVTEEDSMTIVEPAGYTVWLLEYDDGEFLKLPNGRFVSSRHRHLMEVILFELVTMDKSKKRSFKACYDWHLDFLLGKWNILTPPDELPLIVLDDLLSDPFITDYMTDKYDPYFLHIHRFFKENKLEDVWVNLEPLNKISRDKYLIPGEFSKAVMDDLDKKSKKKIKRIYEVIIDKIEELGAPDMNLVNQSGIHVSSLILRLFWAQDLITTEYLLLMDNKEEISTDSLRSLENLKRYRNLLHDGNQEFNELMKSFPSRTWEMPDEAVIALKAGLRSLTRDYQLDFSLPINSVSKSLEIILKTQI